MEKMNIDLGPVNSEQRGQRGRLKEDMLPMNHTETFGDGEELRPEVGLRSVGKTAVKKF